jgi:H+/Cl- antiporter ClcA
MKLSGMLKKDSLWLGIVIGVVLPLAGYALMTWLNGYISDTFFDRPPIFRESTVEVIAIFLNVIPFRYYMLKAQMDYTGRGILLVTFIVGLTYFFYYLD